MSAITNFYLDNVDSIYDPIMEEELRTEAIVGFRRWQINNTGSLSGIIKTEFEWLAGDNRARCSYITNGKGPVPHKEREHHCGFNAWFDLNDALANYSNQRTVIVAIAGSGRVQLHEGGFRSERAQLLALYFNPGVSELESYFRQYPKQVSFLGIEHSRSHLVEESLIGCRDEKFVCRAAEKYRVPLFYDLAQMHDFSIAHGFSPNKGEFFLKETHAERKGADLKITFASGREEWWRAGVIHRDGDKPAIIYPDGSSYWYRHGKVHRGGDKPAVVTSEGIEQWWQDGKLHREAGKPAILGLARPEWWVFGNPSSGQIIFEER